MSNVADTSTNSLSAGGRLLFSWVWVGAPLAWGVWQTLVKSLALFH